MNRHSGSVKGWQTLAAAALTMFAVGCATAPNGDAPALVGQVEAARTPAEHEALAQEYDRQASRAREQAEQHRALLSTYRRGTEYRWVDRAGFPGGMRAMPRHCEQLIRNDEEDARIYAEMAEQHRQWVR